MYKRQVLDGAKDLVKASANNYYSGVTQQEVEDFYKLPSGGEGQPISRGLNSTLVKKDGKLVEEVWKIGGKYSNEITNIVKALEKAQEYALTEQQREVIRLDVYKRQLRSG